MMTYVARRYRFQGRHHVPDLPEPWSIPHEHTYTVEVVARVPSDARIVVDTDEIDAACQDVGIGGLLVGVVDLDAEVGPENTTVEALAQRWLRVIRDAAPVVYRVVVWEDDQRWGAAE